MGKLKALSSDGGQTLVEVSEATSAESSFVQVSPSLKNVSSAMGAIAPVVSAVSEQLKGLAHQPDETTCEISVGFSAEGFAFIAKGKAEANITLKLTWKKPEP